MSNHCVARGPGRSARRSVTFIFQTLVLASLALVSRDALAGYITVNTAIDTTASDDGFCSLREAITAASLDTAWYGCTAGTKGIDIITLHVPPTISFNYPLHINNKSDVYIVGDHYPYPTAIRGNYSGFDVAQDSRLRFWKVHLTGFSRTPVKIRSGWGPVFFERGYFEMFESEISDNDVRLTSDQVAAGIFNDGGRAFVQDSVFQRNQGVTTGGAIANRGILTVIRSSFIANQTRYQGGALYNYDGGVAELTNVTMSGNSQSYNYAGFGGGAIYNKQATVNIKFSTITANQAIQEGGGIRNEGSMTMTRSIIAGNVSGELAVPRDCRGAGTITSGGYNVVGGCDGFVPNNTDLYIINNNPQLNPLNADDGMGGQRFHEPSAWSPAMNAIPGDQCENSLDQRLGSRSTTQACEIGSIELL